MPNKAERTLEVISKVLRTTPEKLPHDAALGEFEHWDSLAQLMILSSLEQEFGLSIEPEAAVELNSVAKLCEYVNLHGAA
jgi:acyl carrier protein